MLAAAAWLDHWVQLGRDVFARGAPAVAAPRQRKTDLTALLRACLAALQAEAATGERYRPRPPPLWRVPDAVARIRRLLPEMPDGSTLVQFLPAVAPEPPEHDLRCRSAVASTFVAGLELACQGQCTLGQKESVGGIEVHATPPVALATPVTEAGG